MRTRTTVYKALLRNTAANGLSSAVVLVAEVVVFAVLVRVLPAAEYGLYLLAAGLIGQFDFLELGLSQGLERYLPTFRAEGRERDAGRAVAFTLAVYVGVGLLVAVGIVAFVTLDGAPLLAGEHAALLVPLLLVAAAFAPVLWPFRALGSVLIGADRMPQESVVQGAASILRAGTLIALALRGASIETLLVASMLVTLGGGLVRAVLVGRLFGRRAFGADRRTLAVGREILGYSTLLGTQRFVVSFVTSFDRMIVSALIGPQAVPVFWAAMRFIRLVPGLVGNIAKRAILPIAAELHTTGGSAALHDLVLRGTRLYSACMVGVMTALTIAAPLVLKAFGGEDLAAQTTAVQASMVLLLSVVTRGVLIRSALVKTSAAVDSTVLAVARSLTYLGALGTFAGFGHLGLAIGCWALVHMLFSPLWVYRLAARIELPVPDFFRSAVRGSWCGALLIALLVPATAAADGLPILIQASVVIVVSGIAGLVAVLVGVGAQERRRLTALVRSAAGIGGEDLRASNRSSVGAEPEHQ